MGLFGKVYSLLHTHKINSSVEKMNRTFLANCRAAGLVNAQTILPSFNQTLYQLIKQYVLKKKSLDVWGFNSSLSPVSCQDMNNTGSYNSVSSVKRRGARWFLSELLMTAEWMRGMNQNGRKAFQRWQVISRVTDVLGNLLSPAHSFSQCLWYKHT